MSKAKNRNEVPIHARLLKTSVLATVVLALSNMGYASAEQEPKLAEPRASVTKAREARASQTPARSKMATQKLMRYPWEKPKPREVLVQRR